MSGVHGEIANAVVDIWKGQGLPFALKWVDDRANSREPCQDGHFMTWYSEGLLAPGSGSCNFIEICYRYDKVAMLAMVKDLQVPWHLMKGQDFDFIVEYVGFLFDLLRRTVSLPERKWLKFHHYERHQVVLAARNISLCTEYMNTKVNLADVILRVEFGPEELEFHLVFEMPDELKDFVAQYNGAWS
ncbi:hypothetical protein DFH08DRAFT_820947 [Mycena albidolilacea]|uniref:Uncharacterized protein n=1 Tax=Mycena albidolilacea TaxID=1033008 RepID=A0AAD7EEM8_9AGAR|nr:hypothetical protein DFH08DRAFT_820947 [Mycena albidolilacea]